MNREASQRKSDKPGIRAGNAAVYAANLTGAVSELSSDKGVGG